MDRSLSKILSKLKVKYLFLAVAAAISIFPFVWIFIGSTNTSADITMGKMTIGNNLVQNWENLNKNGELLTVFLNTAKITVITAVLSILICSLAGFGFEKYRSRGTEIVYALFLLSMMIPFAAQMIPLFKMMNAFNLIDNHLAIILPNISMPFLIFFFRQNFKAFPNELIEAARIDGLNEFQIFFKIVLPSMKSTVAAGAIYSFMKQWNNYLWPLIILQTNQQKTLTLFISSLSSAYFVDYGPLMLSIVLSTLPVIVIFITMQKQFVEGIVGTSK